MLNKVFAAIDGKKTYIVSILGIIVALVGHFWGPLTFGGVQIPQESWNDVWKAVQLSGLASTLRHAISKN